MLPPLFCRVDFMPLDCLKCRIRIFYRDFARNIAVGSQIEVLITLWEFTQKIQVRYYFVRCIGVIFERFVNFTSIVLCHFVEGFDPVSRGLVFQIFSYNDLFALITQIFSFSHSLWILCKLSFLVGLRKILVHFMVQVFFNFGNRSLLELVLFNRLRILQIRHIMLKLIQRKSHKFLTDLFIIFLDIKKLKSTLLFEILGYCQFGFWPSGFCVTVPCENWKHGHVV